jgi:hypothetical protein
MVMGERGKQGGEDLFRGAAVYGFTPEVDEIVLY